MKLTAIFLLAACLQIAARGHAQTLVTLSVKNAPMKEVFKEIQKQTGLNVLVNEKVLEQAGKVTLDVKGMPVEQVLNLCFKGENLTYTIVEGTIVVKPKENQQSPTEVLTIPPADVHGRVLNEDGEPVEGAAVKVKGTNIGTSTNSNGEFSLKGIAENSILVFSGVNIETTEIKVNGKNDLAISVKNKVTNLNDVVISKGYYSEKQRLSTGDVGMVTSKEISEQPVTDVMQAMEAKVPGLYIAQNSGIPGAYASIRILGANSFFNGTDPLYIVDGVPYSATSLTSPNIGAGILGSPFANGNNGYASNISGGGVSPFSLLNPDDIESIEVLKDADATAIYGSRGANGVILITTKKGKAGNTRVDVSISEGAGKVARMMDLLNTQQYLQMRNQAIKNDGLLPSFRNGDYDLLLWDTTRYTNWQKLLLGNTAHYTNAQLSLSGGNANTQFLVSGNFNRETTVFPGDYADQKASGFFNLNHHSSSGKFTVVLSSSYLYDKNDVPATDIVKPALTLPPDAPAIYNSNGDLNWQLYNNSATWSNPLSYTLTSATSKSNMFVSSLNLGYQILSGLRLSSDFGYNRGQMDQVNLTPGTSIAPPGNTNPNNRSNNFGTSENATWNIEPQLSYNRLFGKSHLDALIGTTFQGNTASSNTFFSRGYSSDALIQYPASASTLTLGGNQNSIYHYNAIYARLGYNWDDEYLINLTGRRDGSSRFGPGRQWGDFGAVGVGWIFTRVTGLTKNISWLSFGKLQASYGLTGNDQINNYQFLSAYTANTTGTYLGITPLQPNNLSNAFFGWETVRKLDGGIELGFFRDRVDIKANYYVSRSGNQLIQYSLPWLTGFSSVTANSPATMQNTAWEFLLQIQNIQTKYFRWASSFNVTLPNNKVISYPNIQNSSYAYQYFVGQSIFSHDVYHYAGINPQTGVYSFQTQNLNGVPTSADYIISKPVTQSAYGGFYNSFSYKGFQLDIMFQFVKQLGYDYLQVFSAPGVAIANEPVYVLNAWGKPGDISYIEKYTSSVTTAFRAISTMRSSDAAIADASFVRLKNLALSYQLPQSIRGKTFRNISLFFQAENLLTFTNYQGLDPETMGYALPPLRMITLGLKAGF